MPPSARPAHPPAAGSGPRQVEKGTALRGDTERNINRLLEALETFDLDGSELTMRQLASAAGVSSASAYRYFGSVDGVITAFRLKVSQNFLERSRQCSGQGSDLLTQVCACWVDLSVQHGRALTRLRSRDGYLVRLAAGDPSVVMQQAALQPALPETYAEIGVPDLGAEGLFLWSQIFDPRGILDLAESYRLSVDTTTHRLVTTLVGALRGYASVRASD